MKINQEVFNQFLDVELTEYKKVYETFPKGGLTVKFLSHKPLKFDEVRDILQVLATLDKFTKWSAVDTIIKSEVVVLSNEVKYTMWIDDVNLDPFFGGNKEGVFYKEMLKSIKGLVI